MTITAVFGARAPRPRLSATTQTDWHCRGRLPHWEAGEVAQSITFRLADSLPRTVLDRLSAGEMTTATDASTPSRHVAAAARRARFEDLLDVGHGARILANPIAGEIVQDTLRRFDGEKYRLHAWCVMPNHVHVLATPINPASLSSIVHIWKSFTAKAINAALARSGTVWFEEYFDRAVRNEEHFQTARAYIEDNPVKAGLCAAATDWSLSSAWERLDAGGAPALRATLLHSGA